jgi:methyl-accepting chemotaxis protein
MERQDLVANVQKALQNVSETIMSAVNELRLNMNTKIAQMHDLRCELERDYDAYTGIALAVDDFVYDMNNVAEEMENVSIVVEDILTDLDELPCELVVESDLDFEDDEQDGIDE